MKKTIISTLILLPLSFGCITTVVDNIPTARPSNIEVTPSNVEVGPTATIPPIYPTPTQKPNPLDGYENYCNGVYCKHINLDSVTPKLDYPLDLAVTKDGKKVFVLNKRKNFVGASYLKNDETNKYSCNYNKGMIDRQFIYEIDSNKNISILKVNGEAPFSCFLSEEIEIDNKDNIYVTTPLVDNSKMLLTAPYSSHNIYKISNNKIDLYTSIKLEDFDNQPSGHAEKPRILTNLHITNDNEFLYMLRSTDIEAFNRLYKLDINKKVTHILSYDGKYNQDIADYSVYNGYIYNPYFKIFIKERDPRFSSITDITDRIYLEDNSPTGQSYFLRTIIDNNGNVFISDSEKNTIWKITSYKKVIKFAGNGNVGYKDGKGEEAQFNNPTTMVFDGNGNMFVADSGNNAIRKITSDGNVSTFYKENN